MPFIEKTPQEVQVEEGHVYQVRTGLSTRAGFNFEPGDLIVVIEKTSLTPYKEVGPHGYNWVCTTRFSTSVWATLENCIACGLLKRIYPLW
mgnify:CR=1 FL=1